MKKKEENSPAKHSKRPFKKHEDQKPDKRYPNPDDPNEKIGPPIKEMPIKVGSHHPHDEEILDSNPK